MKFKKEGACVCDVCKCRATLNAVEPLNGIMARIHLANQSGNCVRLCDGKDPLTPGENILCAKPFNYTFLHHHHTCACRRGQFFSISAGHARAICAARTRTGEQANQANYSAPNRESKQISLGGATALELRSNSPRSGGGSCG